MTIKNTIDTYRKRRNQLPPLALGIIALLLVVIGILIVIISTGGGKTTSWNPFSTKTFTPTVTFTLTNTSLPTETSTITLTPTETATGTPAGPYEYTVQQNDSLFKIVQDHNLGDNGILLILMLNPYDAKTKTGIDPQAQTIFAGQKITLPNPGMPFPTATPWPTDAASGTRITYFVLPGDSLGSIAAKMRSTVADIVNLNKTILTNGVDTTLYPGWTLIVRVNLVTVTPLPSPTRTITPTHTETRPPTETPTK